MDPLEVFDVGDGRYVVDVRLWGKGKRSGVEVDRAVRLPVHAPRSGRREGHPGPTASGSGGGAVSVGDVIRPPARLIPSATPSALPRPGGFEAPALARTSSLPRRLGRSSRPPGPGSGCW